MGGARRLACRAVMTVASIAMCLANAGDRHCNEPKQSIEPTVPIEDHCNVAVIVPLIEPCGVGRCLGVGCDLGVGVALGVALGVPVAVAVGVGEGVGVAFGV